MTYVALVFDAPAAEAEAWADALLEAGASSVDVADPAAGTSAETPIFGEPGEPAGVLWPVNRLTALFAAGTDPALALASAARDTGLSPPRHQCHPVAEQDWVRATQAQFGPMHITGRLWVVPSWCSPPDAQAINLSLDPGLAFGTGSHPTTRLCLEWLAANLSGGESVLDYGCGSGILAIAAARLGAGTVAGIDVDPQAVTASRHNAARNGVAATFALPDEPGDGATCGVDLLVANILANPLVLLAPALSARVRRGGRILLSGILLPQAADVAAAYAQWFNIAVCARDGDWVALAGERTADPGRPE